MKTLFVLIAMISFNAQAFHAVTEILPAGQLLICKDYGQVKKGQIVENHVREQPGSEQNLKTMKKDEFNLPGIGSKISLFHKDFHFKGSVSSYHKEQVGTAVIVEAKSLVGSKRIKKSSGKTKFGKMQINEIEISEQDAVDIDKDCIVALTENNLVLKELTGISW